MKSSVSLICLLFLGACASSPPGHPHGHGHRDSPGRAVPTALPLAGYEYRFRPDPQGLGRDLPPASWVRSAEARPPAYPEPLLVIESRSVHQDRSVYERRESYSEQVYGEVEIDGEADAYEIPPAGPEAFY